jgi:hypothetical protein
MPIKLKAIMITKTKELSALKSQLKRAQTISMLSIRMIIQLGKAVY